MPELRTSETYVEGRRFRVVKEGARFEGLLLFGEASMSGWSRKILRGELLTCLGWKEVDVFGTQMAGVMWTGAKVPDNAMVMQVWPFQSLFRPYPMDGVLEPYEEPVEDADDELSVFAPPVDTHEPAAEEIDDGETVDLTAHLIPIVHHEPEEEDEDIVDLTQF